MNEETWQYILARLKEASTWRGLVGCITASGIALNPDQVQLILTVGMLIGGVIGIFFPDKKVS